MPSAVSITDHLPFRLRWHGGKGFASGNSVIMALIDQPELGFVYVELDYAPGVCALVRRAACHAVSDMTVDEVMACRAFLAALD